MEKLQALDSGEAELTDSLSKIERKIVESLRGYLNEMDRENGRLILNANNRRILVRAANELDKIVKKDWRNPTEEYLSTFDKVDAINSELYSELGVRSIRNQITPAKELIVEGIANRLGSPKQFANELTAPIKQILSKNVLIGSTFKDAELELRTFIQTTIDQAELTGVPEVSLGHLNRYAKQITRDALNQYDGTVKQKIQQDLNLTHFRYVGSIIFTTRSNCRHMVSRDEIVGEPKGSGKKQRIEQVANRFADLRQDDGGYLVADIPTIIERSKGKSGWDPDTTPENYFVKRGGFNCRHEAIPYLYNSRRAQRALRTL